MPITMDTSSMYGLHADTDSTVLLSRDADAWRRLMIDLRRVPSDESDIRTVDDGGSAAVSRDSTPLFDASDSDGDIQTVQEDDTATYCTMDMIAEEDPIITVEEEEDPIIAEEDIQSVIPDHTTLPGWTLFVTNAVAKGKNMIPVSSLTMTRTKEDTTMMDDSSEEEEMPPPRRPFWKKRWVWLAFAILVSSLGVIAVVTTVSKDDEDKSLTTDRSAEDIVTLTRSPTTALLNPTAAPAATTTDIFDTRSPLDLSPGLLQDILLRNWDMDASTLQDTSTSEGQAYAWLEERYGADAVYEDPNTIQQLVEIWALAVFALETQYLTEWKVKTGWLSDNDTADDPNIGEHCAWHGISCTDDDSGAVTTLALASNRVTGTLPPHLQLLVQLKTLILSDNELAGEIPVEWTELRHLQVLKLDRNGLSGTLPESIGDWKELSVLRIERNPEMTGDFPRGVESMRLQELAFYFTGIGLGASRLCDLEPGLVSLELDCMTLENVECWTRCIFPCGLYEGFPCEGSDYATTTENVRPGGRRMMYGRTN